MRRYASVFVIAAVAAGVIFWLVYGRSLEYDVFSGGVYSHSEPFSQGFRIALTLAVALLFGAVAAWLVRAFRRRSS